jgi:hypothetical protein
MTPRERKLREVLNVRLDESLAREIARIAGAQGSSESEIARTLLGYGIEVQRRLEAAKLAIPFEWDKTPDEHQFATEWPHILEIEARRRPMTDSEIDDHGLREYVVNELQDWSVPDGPV